MVHGTWYTEKVLMTIFRSFYEGGILYAIVSMSTMEK